MSEVIPFAGMDKNALMTYLNSPDIQAAAAQFKDDITVYANFPTISIKGKVFTMVQGDDRVVMRRPDNPDEVAQSLTMVILRANDKARSYYAKAYVEGADDQKPTCYSNDNIAPSDNSIEKQSPSCPTCKWAVFGTATRTDGTPGKGTACRQTAKLAVAAPDALDKPHMMVVPPTSLKPLREAIKIIKERNIPYPVVTMRISFVPEEASPLLKFVPTGLLGPVDAGKAIAMREDTNVRAICGLDERSAPAPAAKPADQKLTENLAAGLDAAIAERAAPKPEPASPAPGTKTDAPASTPAPTSVSPAAATTTPAKPAVTVASGDLLGELTAMLGTVDG